MTPADRLAAAYLRVRQLVDLWTECPVTTKATAWKRKQRLKVASQELAEALAQVLEK